MQIKYVYIFYPEVQQIETVQLCDGISVNYSYPVAFSWVLIEIPTKSREYIQLKQSKDSNKLPIHVDVLSTYEHTNTPTVT